MDSKKLVLLVFIPFLAGFLITALFPLTGNITEYLGTSSYDNSDTEDVQDLDEDYNVLFISVHSFRADNAGFNGYERDTTPNLDELAEESTVFTDAVSSSGSTALAFATVFSSQHAYEDNLTGSQSGNPSEPEWSWDTERSLIKNFNEEGYNTNAVVSQDSTGSEYGFDEHFERFDEDFEHGEVSCEYDETDGRDFEWVQECWEYRTAEETTELGIEMIEESEEPFFQWLHYADLHAPYIPPEEEYLEMFQQEHDLDGEGEEHTGYVENLDQNEFTEGEINELRDQYDSGIRYTDSQISYLIEFLKQEGMYEDTIIVVTGDHGHCLGEGNHIGHNNLHECAIEVPLILKTPEHGSSEETGNVNLIDLFPTLLDLTDIDYSDDVRGVNLFEEAPRTVDLLSGIKEQDELNDN